MAQPTRSRIHAADYYQLPEYEQNDLIQLIDGEVIIAMPPTPKHQAIVGAIFFLLMTIAKQRGGKAFTAPVEVYLDEQNIYEPDVLYLTPATQCKIDATRLTGAPELVVEVLSPRTARYDRQEKYRAYEQHHVSEYWIIDPVHEIVEVWKLMEGRFERIGAYAGDDTFQSPVLNENISVQAILES
jgi:Uma2 family endonuclease